MIHLSIGAIQQVSTPLGLTLAFAIHVKSKLEKHKGEKVRELTTC